MNVPTYQTGLLYCLLHTLGSIPSIFDCNIRYFCKNREQSFAVCALLTYANTLKTTYIHIVVELNIKFVFCPCNEVHDKIGKKTFVEMQKVKKKVVRKNKFSDEKIF